MKNESVIIDRKQIFLLFLSSIVIMILIFGVGVLLGKKLSAVSVNCYNPQEVLSKNEKTEESKTARSDSIPRDTNVIGPPPEREVDNPTDKNKTEIAKEDKNTKDPLTDEVNQKRVENKKKEEKTEVSQKNSPKVKQIAKIEGEKNAPKTSEIVDAKFTIQVGAFPDRTQALKMAAELEKKGYESWIQRGKSKDRDIFRVRIGKFPSKQDAEKFKQQFDKKERYNSFITSLE